MTALPTRPEPHRADRGRRGVHLRRKLLAGMLVAGVIAGPFASGGRAASNPPKCSVPGQITPHSGWWYSIKGPAFPTGQQVIWDYAVHPLQPEHIFVTNGAAVMRSLDSGCHWSLAYSLGDGGLGLGAATARILEIEMAAPDVLYLPIQEMDPVPKPHVVVSQNAGETWSSSDGGLLESLFGRIRDLDASLTDGDAAGLLVDVELTEPGVASIEGEQSLFVTNNAGASWELRHSFDNGTEASAGGLSISINATGELSQLAMNPGQGRSNEIWIYGEKGVLYSDGVNVNEVGIGTPELLDISFIGGDSVIAYEQSATQGQLSVNGGRSFETLDTGLSVDSVDLVLGQPQLLSLVGSLGRVFFQVGSPQRSVLLNASPADGRGISDPQAAVVEGQLFPAIFGRTTNTIEVSYEPKPEREPINEVMATVGAGPDLVGDNRLVPASKRVEMRVGQNKTIPYQLDLPAATTPLDVYFMIDISGSMQGTINGIRSAMQEIVDRLAQLKIDVAFGVGSFRSYNDPPAYDRVRDIGPAGAEVAAALNSLEAQGGGQETQMAALLESATGEGRNGIQPNLNMHFRPGSLRVAIEVTDEPISQGGAHPGYQTVIDGLVEHDVKMVGLAIQGAGLLGNHDYDDPGPPADVLQLVATGSKATAPAGGVDCDGDAEPEIAEGGPIVCQISPDEAEEASLMADAIVNVLGAVQDVQDLDVTVTPAVDTSDSSEVVEAIEPEAFPAVDLKEPSRHEFDLTVACPEIAKRTTYPLRVAVNRRGGPLGTADLTLVCSPRPDGKKKDKVLPFITAFAPVAAVLPPVPRPPDPVPEPNPNPQPNPQQNPQAQAGFAAQEQQQPQVALAHANPPEAAEQVATEDHFMTARRESRVPPVGFVFTAGAITSLFAYMTVRTSVRTQGAHGRRRRRRPS